MPPDVLRLILMQVPLVWLFVSVQFSSRDLHEAVMRRDVYALPADMQSLSIVCAAAAMLKCQQWGLFAQLVALADQSPLTYEIVKHRCIAWRLAQAFFHAVYPDMMMHDIIIAENVLTARLIFTALASFGITIEQVHEWLYHLTDLPLPDSPVVLWWLTEARPAQDPLEGLLDHLVAPLVGGDEPQPAFEVHAYDYAKSLLQLAPEAISGYVNRAIADRDYRDMLFAWDSIPFVQNADEIMCSEGANSYSARICRPVQCLCCDFMADHFADYATVYLGSDDDASSEDDA